MKLSLETWSRVVEDILVDEPFNCSRENAKEYSIALQESYEEFTDDPQVALEADMECWDE